MSTFFRPKPRTEIVGLTIPDEDLENWRRALINAKIEGPMVDAILAHLNSTHREWLLRKFIQTNTDRENKFFQAVVGKVIELNELKHRDPTNEELDEIFSSVSKMFS